MFAHAHTHTHTHTHIHTHTHTHIHTHVCQTHMRCHLFDVHLVCCCYPAGDVLRSYHNRVHAADVLQSLHLLLTKGGLKPHYADPLTMMAAYLAAVRCCCCCCGYITSLMMSAYIPLLMYGDIRIHGDIPQQHSCCNCCCCCCLAWQHAAYDIVSALLLQLLPLPCMATYHSNMPSTIVSMHCCYNCCSCLAWRHTTTTCRLRQ